jgi:hypothetical protein
MQPGTAAHVQSQPVTVHPGKLARVWSHQTTLAIAICLRASFHVLLMAWYCVACGLTWPACTNMWRPCKLNMLQILVSHIPD